MITLVFLLEELSAKVLLEILLPRVLPVGVEVKYVVFQGKQDLEKNLWRKLHSWNQPNCRFLIMRDQDAGDCHAIKQNLIRICERADKQAAVVRIACRELESFYLGDLAAVEAGFGLKGIAKLQNMKKFRTPDRLANPSAELDKLTKDQYDKVSGSRKIANYLSVERNRSASFQALVAGIRRLAES